MRRPLDALPDIETDERALTHQQIEEGLETGTLRSTDLIYQRGTWITLADSLPFSETAAPVARAETRVRWLKGAGWLLLWGVFLAALIWFRL